MKSWNVNDVNLKPHAPQILSSTKDAALSPWPSGR
jgi:hypothetical protein